MELEGDRFGSLVPVVVCWILHRAGELIKIPALGRGGVSGIGDLAHIHSESRIVIAVRRHGERLRHRDFDGFRCCVAHLIRVRV